MTSHAPHEDVHTWGLQNGCPRCEELALHPDQLDYDMQRRLLRGQVLGDLEALAARQLAGANPHRFEMIEWVSFCGRCGLALTDPVHGEPM